ncbi:FACT complex subunit Ssrp1 [Rhagoletis pomonella]|uniref:FACT complex subunit Ssrp1 n=1 Tax=Rhagoletis pomonella TaxID=28610 RepID=UPI00177B4767|nr:FACT complex subunit Ssrp1 [Rhagoletis pomonella]
MADVLEYSDITAEVRGVLTPGRLKLTDQHIIFKNNKTGKVEQIAAEDIELINSQKFVGNWGLRIFTKNGTLHRFCGFRDSEHEKLGKFLKKTYNQDMVEKELCVKGWNWGTARFLGSALSFDKDSKTIFEIPLQHVSQCMTGKNEVTLEFHQSDDAPVGLLEMRFHIPAVESADEDPVESFQNNVMSKASVISASGDAIAIFREIHCLTPRGRYDIKIFSTFFQLHGKTFDYKIPMDSVLRLFLLPHKDNRQMFLVLSLDPPIKQGQTRYHFLVLLFGPEEETSIELPFTDEELKEKYEGKIEKELSGPLYEVMGKVMKVLIGRKITGPGNFIGHSGTAAIGCSFKAAAGYLYPLERGFIYIHKPPLHIRFEEVASVNFARSGGSTRSFDFEITLKNGTVNTFSSIEKEEYAKLFDYIQQKKLRVSNIGKDKGGSGYNDVDFGDSDNENEPDVYLARVKAEAREKESDDDEGSDEESTDEDFKPNEAESDVAEEYDSNVQSDSDDSDASGGGGGGGGSDSGAEKKKKAKKEKKEKKERKERVKKTSKTKKDANKPKRATTAFMLWLNETREQIKKDNPGIKVTEIAKKAGEMWKEMKDKSKWEELAAKDKQRYQDEMKDYKPTASEESGSKSAGATKKRKKESPTKKSPASTGGFKSKEYISDDESSSDNEDKKDESGAADSEPEKKKSKSADKSVKDDKKKKKKEDSDEESEASASGGSDEEDDEEVEATDDGEGSD